jgi:glycogen debranching enzyme
MATNTDASPSTERASRRQTTDGRKKQVLTKGRATVVQSITDAVVAKDGEPFFLCEPDGQVPIDGRHGYGLYHHDCRFLAGYELRLGGRTPDALAATEASSTKLVVEVTNPDLATGAGNVPKEQVGITWSRTVDASALALRDELAIRNYGPDPVELPVELRFAAGFEDVFLIRGLLAQQPGEKHGPSWDGDVIRFSYSGGDAIERSIAVTIDRHPDERLEDDDAEARERSGVGP